MNPIDRYFEFVDAYLSPDYPRGKAAGMRDFRWIWGVHILLSLLMLWLVEQFMPESELKWWLDISIFLLAFVGFPVFAFIRYIRIQHSYDLRFDEDPEGMDGYGFHPWEIRKRLEAIRRLRRERGVVDEDGFGD